jgi:hypothetical protein
MISRGQMYRQLYYAGGQGITSLDAGAPSIKYTGDIKPQMASAPDPMAELYNMFLDLKQQGQIPKEMGFEQFKQLMEEQTSSQNGIMDMVPREQALFGGIKKAVAQPVSGGDTSGGGFGKMRLMEKLIQQNPEMFKPASNQQNPEMFRPASNQQRLLNASSLNRDFIDLNENGIDDREEQALSEEGIMQMVPREQALFGGRVNYGLGSSFKKAVKKVTGAVKDVVKSDLGKAALAGAALYYGGGGNLFGFQRAGLATPGFALSNLPGYATLFGTAATGPTPFSSPSASTPGIFSKALKGLTSKTGLAALGIAGTSVLAGLSTADKEEIDQADPSDRGRIVKEKLRQSLTNLGYTGEELETKLNEGVSEYFGPNMAVGGRVMKAYGDIASMASGIEGLPMRTNQAGINELDLRNTGGFIPPVGIKEKADDIPAMLSNNEFVFTADAVRAAGGGSVEKGAQKMYDLMKSLEGKIA